VRPGRAADHSPPSSAAVMEDYSYTSTHPLGHTGSLTRSHFTSNEDICDFSEQDGRFADCLSLIVVKRNLFS